MPAVDSANLLIQVYRDPARAKGFNLSEWDLLIRQARSAQLLATLHHLLKDNDLLPLVPGQANAHLEGARAVADKHANDIRWEISKLGQALAAAEIPLVLLKGAAYVSRALPCHLGRVFQDVDILVPRGLLQQVEQALFVGGWATGELSSYDRRYYRTWMHELPPMHHVRRRSQLDVHHHIVPLTAAVKPDPALIWESTQPVNGDPRLRTLSPQDMILHSAVHLFHDGEFDHALRDLTDIDRLIRHFLHRGEISLASLQARAKQLDLERPWFYAQRYLNRVLNAPYLENSVRHQGRPLRAIIPLMDFLFLRGIAQHHHSCRGAFAGLAKLSLYLRAHYLRMPPHLLIPHLIRKAFDEGH